MTIYNYLYYGQFLMIILKLTLLKYQKYKYKIAKRENKYKDNLLKIVYLSGINLLKFQENR